MTSHPHVADLMYYRNKQWMTHDAANVVVDELAGQAWEEGFNAIQHHQIAPHHRHSMAMQTILHDGSILSNLACTIQEVITAHQGKLKLQDTLKMALDRMELIKEEITVSNVSKFGKFGKFGKSSIARAHFSKQYTQQWYTYARAHHLDDRISATCKCCNNDEAETILQILGCPSRNGVHTELNEIFERKMREIEAPNHLLQLFEVDIELALMDGDRHSGKEWKGNLNESRTERTISELLSDGTIPQQY